LIFFSVCWGGGAQAHNAHRMMKQVRALMLKLSQEK
jgi:hypothetical protein